MNTEGTDLLRTCPRTFRRTMVRTVAEPSLYLDFTASNTLDPRITFTRATTATFFNSSGVLSTAASGEARFDYNPTTLAARGLLIEEQRTNLCLQSQTFQTTWSALRTIISVDAAVAPDSTLTGDKFIATSVAGSHLISQTISVTAQAYTLTCFAKAGEYNFIQLNIPDPGAGGAGKVGSFNLSTGTLGVVQDPGVTRTITSVGNGWYRCSITFTVTGAGSSAVGFLVTNTDVRAESFTGNNVNGIFIWGAQLEVGAFATSYIPTTTTALTRNADVASMTGTNFSDWYNAVEGSLFGEFSVYTSVGSKAIVGITDGTNNNRVQFFAASNDPFVLSPRLVAGGVATNPANTGSIAVNSVGKAIIAYAVGTNAGGFSVNGSSIAQSSPASAFSNVNSLEIGKATGLTQLNGYIRRIAYYPVRLADTTLQALTA